MTMNISIKYAGLPNGLNYFYQHWFPDRPRALIVFVHGLGDHIGRYGEFVSHLANAGFAVALYDQMGHGRSGGRRGHVERFSDWVNDLASFVQFSQMSVPPDTPFFLVGTSLGALIGINFILTHTTPIVGMVALSAAIEPTVHISPLKKKMVRKLVRIAPELSINNGIRLEDLTNDPAEVDALRSDGLFHRGVTLGAALEIDHNLELVMAMAHRIHIPMLMLAGSDDRVCAPDGTRQFSARLSSVDKLCHIFPGMAHDLLHDAGREKVIEAIEEWIGGRLHQKTPADKQFLLSRRETLWQNVSPS